MDGVYLVINQRVGTIVLIVGAGLYSLHAEDSLTPLGPPGSDAAKMKSLNQLEPRTPITTLPFAVTNSGAYYLMGTLIGTNAADGIIIFRDDVQVDLRGFSLIGVPGSSNGIMVGNSCHNISIHDGVVRGWGASGIAAGMAHESEINSVTAFTNDGDGIVMGDNALVTSCGAFKNKGTGIRTSVGGTVTDSKVRDNGGAGIVVDSMSRVLQSSANRNGTGGIAGNLYCVVRNCVAAENLGHGISVDSDSRVLENSCSMNDPQTGAGLCILGRGNRVENNNVTRNRYGILMSPASSGNLVINNSASGNTNNYWGFGGGNTNAFGVLVNVSAGGAISNVTSWANFEY